MTPEHVEAARRALDTWTNDDAVVVRWDGPDARTYVDPAAAVAKLDRAGMLRTGLEREAIEAAEAAARYWEGREPLQEHTRAHVAIGRRALALKQPPKPRWEAYVDAGGVVARGQRVWWVGYGSIARGPWDTEAEAKAVAAALNACDTEAPNA